MTEGADAFFLCASAALAHILAGRQKSKRYRVCEGAWKGVHVCGHKRKWQEHLGVARHCGSPLTAASNK